MSIVLVQIPSEIDLSSNAESLLNGNGNIFVIQLVKILFLSRKINLLKYEIT